MDFFVYAFSPSLHLLSLSFFPSSSSSPFFSPLLSLSSISSPQSSPPHFPSFLFPLPILTFILLPLLILLLPLPSVPSLTLPLPLPFTPSFPSYSSSRTSSLPSALSIPPSLFFFLSQISLRLFPLFLLLTPPPFPCTYFLPTISLSPFLLHPYTSPPPPKNKSNSHKRLSLSPFWERGSFFG